MAKRFIDTELFNDEWFCELSKDSKLFFLYFITNCDHAGILKLNRKLFEFQTGIKNFDIVMKEFGNRLVTIKDNLFFMPKYIFYQYPDFPKSQVKQQISAVKILDSHGITLEKLNTYLTLNKDLPKNYVNVNVNDNVIINKVEKFKKPNIEEINDYCKKRNNSVDAVKFFNYYESNGWKIGKNPMKNWEAAVRTWEKNSEPINNLSIFKTKKLL